MSKSVLLNLARSSIEEVLQAQNTIDRTELLEKYPILSTPMGVQVTLYLGDKIRGSSKCVSPDLPLIDAIILHAKLAAFQDPSFVPIATSEYLHASIELILLSPDGPLSHKDEPIIKE